MSGSAPIKVFLHFTDPSLDLEERDLEVQRLLPQMQHLDVLEGVWRVPDPSPPSTSKGFGFLMGLLQAEVSLENFRRSPNFWASVCLIKPSS
jgi:hypothetical protein